jgi:hypothetical protein
MKPACLHPVVHLELHTGNLARACAFYEQLCRWRPERIDAGPCSYPRPRPQPPAERRHRRMRYRARPLAPLRRGRQHRRAHRSGANARRHGPPLTPRGARGLAQRPHEAIRRRDRALATEGTSPLKRRARSARIGTLVGLSRRAALIEMKDETNGPLVRASDAHALVEDGPARLLHAPPRALPCASAARELDAGPRPERPQRPHRREQREVHSQGQGLEQLHIRHIRRGVRESPQAPRLALEQVRGGLPPRR